MAYQNNYQQNNYQQNNGYQQNNQGRSLNVSSVRQWNDGSVSFALTISGVTVYGMRVINYTDKQTGQPLRFVAFPRRKGNDGKYYHVAYCKLMDNEVNDILNMVDNALRR